MENDSNKNQVRVADFFGVGISCPGPLWLARLSGKQRYSAERPTGWQLLGLPELDRLPVRK